MFQYFSKMLVSSNIFSEHFSKCYNIFHKCWRNILTLRWASSSTPSTVSCRRQRQRCTKRRGRPTRAVWGRSGRTSPHVQPWRPAPARRAEEVGTGGGARLTRVDQLRGSPAWGSGERTSGSGRAQCHVG
jgi:hypothetical protein